MVGRGRERDDMTGTSLNFATMCFYSRGDPGKWVVWYFGARVGEMNYTVSSSSGKSRFMGEEVTSLSPSASAGRGISWTKSSLTILALVCKSTSRCHSIVMYSVVNLPVW